MHDMIKKYGKKVITYAFMILVAVVTILPFYTMIIMGTYRSADLLKGLKLLPGDYFIENFKTVINASYIRSYLNSIVVSALSAFLGVMSCAMAGFGFSKYNFKWKKPLFNMVLLLMMIPAQLGLIAFIWEMRMLNWNNTLLPLFLPWIANGFGVFWMSQYINDAVPDEVLDSARIDGCGDLRMFFSVSLAFIRPALMSIGLLIFLWSWNNYMLPTLVLNDVNLYTVPLYIASLRDVHRVDYAAQILGLTLGTMPLIMFFIFFSKSLISGLSDAALKG